MATSISSDRRHQQLVGDRIEEAAEAPRSARQRAREIAVEIVGDAGGGEQARRRPSARQSPVEHRTARPPAESPAMRDRVSRFGRLVSIGSERASRADPQARILTLGVEMVIDLLGHRLADARRPLAGPRARRAPPRGPSRNGAAARACARRRCPAISSSGERADLPRRAWRGGCRWRSGAPRRAGAAGSRAPDRAARARTARGPAGRSARGRRRGPAPWRSPTTATSSMPSSASTSRAAASWPCAAVDQHQVGPGARARAPGSSLSARREAARQHLAHHGEVVARRAPVGSLMLNLR